jgi:hypothetical protein
MPRVAGRSALVCVLTGRILGLRLRVEAKIVDRQRPARKAWQTVGEPHLPVIGAYRMEVVITESGTSSHVRIGIDYALPRKGPGKWLGSLFSRKYARWCVGQMMNEISGITKQGVSRLSDGRSARLT